MDELYHLLGQRLLPVHPDGAQSCEPFRFHQYAAQEIEHVRDAALRAPRPDLDAHRVKFGIVHPIIAQSGLQ